jgi:hypothetical protein
MHWKTIVAVGLVCLLGTAGFALEEEVADERIWFGLGGSTLGLFLPDLAAVDAFLIDNGFGAFGAAVLFTGGRGRGGAVGGLSFGAIGWSGEAVTRAENRYAEVAIGFGGLEAGRVIGGDERSLLTLGVVLGGAGTSLTLLEDVAISDEGSSPLGPCGVVPEPVILGRHGMTLAVEPFVSLQVQPLHNFGFELHLGYLMPLFAFEWGDAELEGVAPRFAGPVISLSATWGAIGRPAIGPVLDRPKVEEAIDQTVSLAGPCVRIDNRVGRITVEMSEAEQAGSVSQVRILAVKQAQSQTLLDQVSVLIEPTRCGLSLHSKGPRHGFWEVEYLITVPAGTEIEVMQAAGDVHLKGVVGTAAIELALGEVEVAGFVGPVLSIGVGAGGVRVVDAEAETIEIEVGTGDVEIQLLEQASYRVVAEAGIGAVSVGPFPGFDTVEASGLAVDVDATLGEGEGSLAIEVLVGEVHVRPRAE